VNRFCLGMKSMTLHDRSLPPVISLRLTFGGGPGKPKPGLYGI
jgi:hypothetical protein